jgi:hypothetical protein
MAWNLYIGLSLRLVPIDDMNSLLLTLLDDDMHTLILPTFVGFCVSNFADELRSTGWSWEWLYGVATPQD